MKIKKNFIRTKKQNKNKFVSQTFIYFCMFLITLLCVSCFFIWGQQMYETRQKKEIKIKRVYLRWFFIVLKIYIYKKNLNWCCATEWMWYREIIKRTKRNNDIATKEWVRRTWVKKNYPSSSQTFILAIIELFEI
jgi:hypothetical protein